MRVAKIKKNMFFGGIVDIPEELFNPVEHTEILPETIGNRVPVWVWMGHGWRMGSLTEDTEPSDPSPPPDIPALSAEVRAERNRLLVEQIDKFNAVRWNLMTEEQRVELTQYYQALLDVPQQTGFPTQINWPTPPSFI